MDNCHEEENINSMIDNYFSYHQEKTIISNIKSKIAKHISTQLTRLNTLKIKQEQQIEKLDKALNYKNKADILMANLYAIKQGLKQVKLYDFEGNEITIDLDENKTPTENANKYYSLYKKTKKAYELAIEMIKETNSQILYYEEEKYFTEQTDSIIDLNDIYSELIDEKPIKEEKQTQIDFVECEGLKIYIGKNKKQNDYILSKLSSPEDLWFHPLNFAGAHILVKLNNQKEEVSDNILLKAAELTKEYSSQKNNSKTSIIYTKRKYVKKANNKLAFVTYKNESEIVI